MLSQLTQQFPFLKYAPNYIIAAGLTPAPWWFDALGGAAAIAANLAAIVGLGIGVLTFAKMCRDWNK